MVHVEVDVQAQVAGQDLAVGLHVGLGAEQPLLFAPPGAEAQGALWRAFGFGDFGDLTRHLKHACGSGGVVYRAWAVVDCVVVRTDDDHF